MQYKIEIIVTEKCDGEEVYRREVALPEQIGMLQSDIEGAMESHEEESNK